MSTPFARWFYANVNTDDPDQLSDIGERTVVEFCHEVEKRVNASGLPPRKYGIEDAFYELKRELLGD